MDEQPNGEEQRDDEAATEPAAPADAQERGEPDDDDERSERSHHGRRHSGMRRGWKRSG